ncbi:hypothetical protein ACI6PS_12830 [Flavobacterium sp. PLA-1-15]|uniref:hypothetical protein n=1 Tax=Flavobacterium sp. PLA-1-15 TaxID=3380533 RepID=UPI003B7CF3CA
MNLNIIGYIIFLLITIYIIVVVGKICYRNGNIFVLELIPNHKELCQQINKILLISYYLINIGYCSMNLISWSNITNSTELVAIIASKTAIIVAILAVLHYLNIFILTNYIQKLIK